MGCCDIIPNGSVHWNITHQKQNGNHKTRDARPPSEAKDDDKDLIKDVITIVEDKDVITVEKEVTRGVDPVKHGIGHGYNHHGKPQGHEDKLRVRLRFLVSADGEDRDRKEAEQALNDAMKAVANAKRDPKTGLIEVHVDVRAKKDTTPPQTLEFPQNPYAQVCVEW